MSARGKVIEITLSQPIKFNDELVSVVKIEIDHINYGLSIDKKQLSLEKRSNFSLDDVCEFVMDLDDKDIGYDSKSGDDTYFTLNLPSPIHNESYKKMFKLVFKTSKNELGQISIITLYRVK